MTRNRTRALALAVVLAATGAVAPSASAVVAASATAPATIVRADAASPVTPEHDTDGTPLVRLTGAVTPGDAILVDGSLLGEVVVVPGDSGRAVLRVRNDGPTAGTLTASVVDAVAFRDAGNASWADDSFYDDLTVNGVPATQLEGRRTVIHEVALDRGATVDIPVDYAFPVEATSGNRAFVGERVFTFDLLLRILGDTPDPDAPGDDAPGDDGPGAVPGDDGPGSGTADRSTATGGTGTTRTATGDAGTSGLVARTGGAALQADPPWLLLAGALLALTAAGAARALRRHRATSREVPE
ncbi:hypothetical protein ACFQ8E_01110 [Isoptericola sp. NPDC056573]|uniref:hypothetical protein n=1 Tax=Isoptericola sp. NPDC056573 TaxID=3345868 RepID=UPI003683EA88